jgi:hypothetical protein
MALFLGVKLQRMPGHLKAVPVRGSQLLLYATSLGAVFLLGLMVLPTSEAFGHAPLLHLIPKLGCLAMIEHRPQSCRCLRRSSSRRASRL